MPTNSDLGRAIRRLRRDQKRTIEALALDADMHPTYLSGIERGRRNPTWDKITSLARTLDVSLAILVQAAEDEAEVACAVRDARARIAVGNTR